MRKKHTGFTLVELMIVVAILGIVAALAYPSYVRYIVKAKRATGMAAVMGAADAMERYRSTHFGSYNVSSDLSKVFVTYAPVDVANEPDQDYTLSLSVNSATTYTILATPKNYLTSCGDCKDGALTMDQTGAKTWTDTYGEWGTKGKLYNCWPSKGGKSC